MRRLRIGLLGCGTVGNGLVQLVAQERERIRTRFGLDVQISRILVRDRLKVRAGVDRRLLTTSALEVLDGDCELIVEAIGGVHAAGSFLRRAIARGRNVVTANKALLAATGGELFAEARRRRVSIGFEASVCGGVPVVGVLRRGLAGDTVESIRGILNGTSNYVLCRMEEGYGLAEAVRLAQAHGFAEADPSLDLSGQDAAQKLQILASLAFDEPVRRVSVTGIETVHPAGGLVTRQVAEARRVPGGIELVVEPRRLAPTDPLARVVDEQNAVLIQARAAGEVWLSGRGAGAMPTAAAILSDVLAAA